MGRLRAAMQSRYKERKEDVKIYTPRNLEELQISFRGERVAKVRGLLISSMNLPNTSLRRLSVSWHQSLRLQIQHSPAFS